MSQQLELVIVDELTMWARYLKCVLIPHSAFFETNNVIWRQNTPRQVHTSLSKFLYRFLTHLCDPVTVLVKTSTELLWFQRSPHMTHTLQSHTFHLARTSSKTKWQTYRCWISLRPCGARVWQRAWTGDALRERRERRWVRADWRPCWEVLEVPDAASSVWEARVRRAVIAARASVADKHDTVNNRRQQRNQ